MLVLLQLLPQGRTLCLCRALLLTVVPHTLCFPVIDHAVQHIQVIFRGHLSRFQRILTGKEIRYFSKAPAVYIEA